MLVGQVLRYDADINVRERPRERGTPLHAQYGLELRQTYRGSRLRGCRRQRTPLGVANRREVFEVFEVFARLRRAGCKECHARTPAGGRPLMAAGPWTGSLASNATVYASLLRSEWHSVENKRVTREFRLTEFGVVLPVQADAYQ